MRRIQPPLTRRSFLGGAAALPAFWSWALADETPPPSVLYRRAPTPITSADQVLNVMEFEALARTALPPAHYAYIATGVDDDLTVVRNHAAFAHYEIRARRFADLTRIDTSRSVLGERWASPLYLSAVSSMRAFHPEAEVAVAAAARARSTRQMLSSGCSATLEEVTAAAAQPPWQQLYPTDDWDVTLGVVRRAERAGCAAVVVTLDGVTRPRNNETLARAMRSDSRVCTLSSRQRARHVAQGADVRRARRLAGHRPGSHGHVGQVVRPAARRGESETVRQGHRHRRGRRVAVAHGADAVIVSNHGGRNEETLRASIDCVPEVVAAVHGKVPVLVDGGIRRGTDIFKALALGATAVGIGRPQAWGLAAFGQPGVEAVLDILNRELADIMRQAGTPTLADITGLSVVRTTA